jgi:predicted permease
MREMLLEHLLLGLAGGAGGAALAASAIPIVQALAPSNLPRVDRVGVDAMALMFTAVTAAAAVLLFGVAPAAVLSRRSVAGGLRVRSATMAERGRRGREALVGVQMALTLALLIGTLLTVRSLWKLMNVPLGFEPRGVVTSELSLPRYSWGASDAAFRVFEDRLLGEVRQLPGVESAALTLQLPAGGERQLGILVPGIQGNSTSGYLFVEWRLIAGDYLDVFRIPLRRGRALGERDRDTGAVLVNEAFARSYFPRTEPLGQRIYVDAWREVVGVVADAREQSATQRAKPTFYQVCPRTPLVWLAVRSRASMAFIEPALRSIINRIDPQVPARITTMESQLAEGRAPNRFCAVVLTTFALFALLLAGSGVFTLSYYTVRERTHEFGIRLALGASPLRVGGMVLQRMLWILVSSLLIGSIVGALGSRLLRSVLYEVTVVDPPTFVLAGVLLLVLSLFASFGPARRAASLDPAITLRTE